MGPDFGKERKFMRDQVFQFLVEKQPQSSYDMPEWRLVDIAKRLELGLFIIAKSKEEYMNLDTLESRMIDVVNKSESRKQ